MNGTKRLTSALVLVGFFSVAVVTQVFVDRNMPSFESLPPFVLPPKVLRIADLGLDSAAASYMWLSAIQNFGIHPENNFGSIYDYISAVNELDPQFPYPYAFGALVLPGLKLVKEGLEIGHRGMEALPDEWIIPYYTGIIYHDQLNDRMSAARLFDIVGHMPSTPSGIRSFALNYGVNKNKRAQTRQLWQSIAKTSNDDIVLERAKVYLGYLDLMDLLDQATAVYRSKYHKNPKVIEDLVLGGIIKTIPANPFGFTFRYDENGRIYAN